MKNQTINTSFRQQAAKDLKIYPYLSASLVALPQKIRLLQHKLETSGISYEAPRVQHSIDSDGRLINKLCEIENLEKTLKENSARVKITKSALESLTQSDYQLLSDFYMNKITCVTLAERFCIDRSSLYRKINSALDRYILACYGIALAG